MTITSIHPESNAEAISLEEIMLKRINLIAEMQSRQYNLLKDFIEASKAPSPWIGPDEAAELLGFNITKSGSHRVRITWLCRQGFITKFRSSRPRRYDRADVLQCAEKLRNGKIHIPSTF